MKSMASVCLAIGLIASGVSAYEVSRTSSGAEIKWSSKQESLVVNAGGGPAGFLAAVQNAMQTWNNAGSGFVFAYGGESAGHSYGVNDGVNLVDVGSLSGSALAVNHKWFQVSTGYILDSDIRFNPAYAWATDGAGSCYDIQNVATHEMGHSLSLDDLYSNSDREKTMYGYAAKGETKKRTLDADDIAGIQYLYPYVPPPPPPPATPPVPAVFINGSEQTTVDSQSPVSVTIGLAANGYAGASADWWVVAWVSPGYWYCLNASGNWFALPDVGSAQPTCQGSLQDLSNFTVLSVPSLRKGSYVFFFGVDPLNGRLDNNIVFDSATLVVTIPAPAAPTGVSASDGSYTDKVRIVWNKVFGAAAYEVWRNSSDNSDAATHLADTAEPTYDDLSPAADTTYYYWIKAKNSAGTGGFSSSDSGIRYPAAAPAAPAGVSASDGTYTDKVRVTWNAVSEAATYEVWRHTGDNSGSATKLTDTTGPSYDDSTAIFDTTYYYWIKAKNSLGTSGFSSSNSGGRYPAAAPAAPSGVSASDRTYTDKVRVTWNAVSGTAVYEIWRNTSNNSGSAAHLADTADPSYNDLATAPDTTYYYWIKAKNSLGTSGFSSSDSGVRYPAAAPAAPSGVSASDGIYTDKVRVTWNTLSEAATYEIWRNTNDNSGSATKLTDTTGTSYDDSTAIVDTTYYYWIKAKNSLGTSGFSSSDSGYRRALVIAWGNNSLGECTVPAEAQSGITAIAVGGLHSLALKDGKVIAWGYNNYGQCTVPADAQSGVTAIAAGYSHSLALKDGKVIAWGDNRYGQCTVPAEAQSGVTAIDGGGVHSLALKDGKVIAWGYNGDGECTVPTDAQSGVTAIAAGWEHSLALKDGKVLAWGYNFEGQCTVPTDAQSGVTAIAAGEWGHSLALKAGKVIAWGDNGSGQCTVPAEAQSGVTAIAAGAYHNLALKDGKVLAWGYNNAGQCTVPAEAQSGVTAIAAGAYHGLALHP